MQILPCAQKLPVAREHIWPAVAVPSGTHSKFVAASSQFSPIMQSVAEVAGLQEFEPQIPKPSVVPLENPSSVEQI